VVGGFEAVAQSRWVSAEHDGEEGGREVAGQSGAELKEGS